MSWSTVPLTAGQLTKIRAANYAGDYLVTLCRNRVVFAGQVNSDLTTPQSWAQFNFNNVTVGAYTDVELDQVLIIGTTNNIALGSFRGRIRKTPTSSIIYSNESSEDFTVGAYFWVIDSYDLTYKLSRPSTNDPATAVEQVDYDLAYAAPRGVVRGLETAYVDDVDSATGKLRLVLDVSANSYAVAHGDSISSYLFTFKAGTATVISGSLASPTVTVDVIPGEQWGKLTMTTANGQVKTRRFYIFAHDASNPPDTGFSEDQLTISGNVQSGWTMTCEAFTGVDTVLANTFAVVRRANENFGGVAGGLDSTNTIAFVGWFQREDDAAVSDPAASVIETARFEFTGFGPRMARVAAQQLPFINVTAPAIWGEIVHLTPWRAICHFLDRYSTATMLADLAFDDLSNAFEFSALSTANGGNVWAAVGGITNQIDAVFETASDGRLQVCRSAEYLSQAQRNALTDYIDYTSQDVLDISRALEQNKTVGKLDADGAYYNLSTGQISVFTVRAPGIAQGEAQGSDTLSNQILTVTTSDTTALNELRQRAGDRLEAVNNTEVLTVRHFDGLTGLQPSKSMLYTFTVDQLDTQGVNRISYNTETLWMLEAVTYGRQGNGTTGVQGQYRRLRPVGNPGDNTTQVAENAVEDPMPDLGMPAFTWEDPALMFPDIGLDMVNPAQLDPPAGQIAATNGDSLLVASTTQAFWLTNFIKLKRPMARDVTPSDLGSYTIRAVAISPFFTKTTIPAYLLASDGTNSAIWYTPNVAVAVPTWTKGTDVPGVYTVLRLTNVDGTVMIYSPTSPSGGGTGAWSLTFDFSLSAGPFTTVDLGTWNGSAWESGDTGSSWHLGLQLESLTTFDVYQAVVSYQRQTAQTGSFSKITDATFTNNWGALNPAVGTYTDEAQNLQGYPTPLATTKIVFLLDSGVYGGGKNFITKITLIGPSRPPLINNGNATVVTTTDYGVTWGLARDLLGTPGSVGGFDVQRNGTVSYAAGAGKVYKASALGGVYSAWYTVPSAANPVVVIIPYYRRNSTTINTSVSDPDVIIGCDNGKWYFIDGTAATATDITPVAGLTPINPDCLSVRWGNQIAAWGTTGGVQKVYTSVDGGVSYTFRSNITSAGKIRCRRDDARVSPNGQIYLAQANIIDYSSLWFSNALYPRTMPTTGITMFDTVY
jgi:hypothetical protein